MSRHLFVTAIFARADVVNEGFNAGLRLGRSCTWTTGRVIDRNDAHFVSSCSFRGTQRHITSVQKMSGPAYHVCHVSQDVSTRSKALFLQMIAYKASDRRGPVVAVRTLSRPADFAAYNASSQPFRSCWHPIVSSSVVDNPIDTVTRPFELPT